MKFMGPNAVQNLTWKKQEYAYLGKKLKENANPQYKTDSG